MRWKWTTCFCPFCLEACQEPDLTPFKMVEGLIFLDGRGPRSRCLVCGCSAGVKLVDLKDMAPTDYPLEPSPLISLVSLQSME